MILLNLGLGGTCPSILLQLLMETTRLRLSPVGPTTQHIHVPNALVRASNLEGDLGLNVSLILFLSYLIEHGLTVWFSFIAF